MTNESFEILKKELQSIVKEIPLQWGATQNDIQDELVNIFSIATYEELKIALQHLSTIQQQYIKRRWFLWKCSECDQYLFDLNRNILLNPNSKSKDFDLQFNNDEKLQFDIKGTIIPKHFRNDINAVINNPQLVIDFFYQEQSKQTRFGMQNRLFIIHHSYRKFERELIIRAHFDFKKHAFKKYAMQMLIGKQLFQYKNAIADVIFIFEKNDATFEYLFY